MNYSLAHINCPSTQSFRHLQRRCRQVDKLVTWWIASWFVGELSSKIMTVIYLYTKQTLELTLTLWTIESVQ